MHLPADMRAFTPFNMEIILRRKYTLFSDIRLASDKLR